MLIFHIATASDWDAARRSGSYATSTLGRTLEEEGFIHAARREQVHGVWKRYYRDCGQSLVVLAVETGRLTSPWREEGVGKETYPHIFGPINVKAVKDVLPLNSSGGTESMRSIFLKDMATRMGLALLVMALSTTGILVGDVLDPARGAALGAIAGLVIGLLLVWTFVQFRRR